MHLVLLRCRHGACPPSEEQAQPCLCVARHRGLHCDVCIVVRLQVTPQERIKFILTAVPCVRRDLRHLLADLLGPASDCCNTCVSELCSAQAQDASHAHGIVVLYGPEA